MSKESIKTSINTYIKENGNMAITGQILNSVMNEMVEGLASEEELATKQDKTSLVSDLATKVNALSSSDKAAFLGQIGAASEGAFESHDNDNTRHITAGERAKWNAKQDALTLTIKDNGNIVIANIQAEQGVYARYTKRRPDALCV